mgnify:CR=1 FL=1
MLLEVGVSALLALSSPSPLAALDSCFIVETTDGSVGTGFLIGGDRIVTASHVVHGQRLVWLLTSAPESQRFRGTVILDDPVSDIAVIEAEPATAAPPLSIASGDFPVGSTAFAIGSPIGGLVLSRGAVLGMRDGLIETDTAVDPGNSGGPLLDEQGRVRGVVVQKDPAAGTALSVPASVLLATLTASPPPSSAPAMAVPAEIAPGPMPFFMVLIGIVVLLALIALGFALARKWGRQRPARIVIRFDEEW